MTFQQPSKSLTPRDYLFIGSVILFVLILSTGLAYANLKFERGGGDFYMHWAGLRGIFVDRIEPYSGEIPARVQMLAYGKLAQAGDEPYILDTPLPLLLFYYPFALLSDPALARAIFTVLLELALFVLIFLSLRLTEWETPRALTVIFTLFGVFNFYSVYALYEANPVVLLGLMYAFILITYYSELDELTGALIFLCLYDWEVGAPFLILICMRAYREDRRRIFAGLFMSAIVMLVVSFLVYPDWLIPFMRAGLSNFRAAFGFSVFSTFSAFWPVSGILFARALVIGLLLLLAYEFIRAQDGNFRQFYWTACLALAAAPLLGLRTEWEHLIVLLFPFAFIFSIVYDRWSKIAKWFTPLLIFLIFIAPWVIFIFGSRWISQNTNEIVFLFPPIFCIIGLYWIRWWALRPPRVWADLNSKNS